MFPGAGRQSYNGNQNYQRPAAPPQGYNRPQGAPPPQNYGSYGAPAGYNRPQGPPPNFSGNYQAPSTAPQRFSNNVDMTFQYSNCSGRKKALLVGINYYGTANELRGCINDVKNMSRFLNERYGYSYDDMIILSDDQRARDKVPIKENIIRGMQWLVAGASPNDSLVFHYSGHGGLTKDVNGDEESGFDDVIYPLDFQQAGFIVDDDMHEIMVTRLPAGCRLTALYDSCHSGTALDLPYVYSTKGVVKEPNLLKDAGTDVFGAFMSYESGNIGGAISTLGGLAKKFARAGSVDKDRVRQMKASPADVISISGSKDDQTSADANINGVATGAMSYAFITVMTQNPNQSYLTLLNNMRDIMAGKYSQKPQLSASHPMDMNLRFFM